jgi:hypothetical protein
MSKAEEALELEAAASVFSADEDIQAIVKHLYDLEQRVRALEGGHGAHARQRPQTFVTEKLSG